VLRWVGGITMDLKEKGWEDLVFILKQMSPHVAQ
jgi:hypothetical protein